MSGLIPLALSRAGDVDGDLVLIGCFAGEDPQRAGLPPAIAAAAELLGRRPGFGGRKHQQAETALGGDGPAVVALRGLGERGELDGPRLRCWIDKACEAVREDGHRRLALVLPEHPLTAGPAAAERIQRQLMISGYRFDRFIGDREEEPRIEAMTLVPPPGQEAAYREQLPVAAAAARAVVLTRDLANTPANEASPGWMEERAREVAECAGLEMAVLGIDELRRRGMGGLLAVGAAAAEPPRLVRLEWGSRGPTVALVGKGITFDSGGLSIKSASSMEDMKYDKCGACTVLALIRAVAQLDLPLVLHAYLPIAENMPGSRAYRPGDILTCYNGKTVEVVNTDAEGRLILADALSLAVEEGADAVVELSTLTGACTIALGRGAAGLYCPDDGMAAELLESAERAGERLWRMPLWREFLEEMKGQHADLKNSGERWGSANTAAAFLSQFVGSTGRWAHLDMAGPASTARDSPRGHGATGYGIALTLDWLRRLAAR